MAKRGKVTQKQMVKAALDEKGWGAGPTELQPVIVEKFNVELSNQVISNYKSQLKREGGEAPAGPPRNGSASGGMTIADLEAVKGLMSRLGAEQVRKLVEMAEQFD
jgi:hypothetical protein